NVLFGIMIGILAAWIYNRFYQTQLPDAFAFFSGRRLVPILSSIFSAVVAGIMYIIWPLVYSALLSFAAWIQALGAVGAGLYGFSTPGSRSAWTSSGRWSTPRSFPSAPGSKASAPSALAFTVLLTAY